LALLGEVLAIRRERAAGRLSLDAAVVQAEAAAARALRIAPLVPLTPALAALRRGGSAGRVP
jgi:hypothetical protein